MTESEVADLIAELGEVAAHAGPGASRELALRCQAAVRSLAREVEAHRRDLRDAAGELPVPVPEPDTLTAKLVRANRILRSERATLLRERDAARAEADALTAMHVSAPAESDCCYALLPDPHQPHEFTWVEYIDRAEAVAAVRRAAGLGPGPGEGEGEGVKA